MGNKVSSTATLTEVMTDVNSNMTSIMQKTVSANSTTCSANNKIALDFTGCKIIGCGINIAQYTNLNCALSSTFVNNSSTSLATIMQQAAQQSAVAQATSVADALSTSNTDSNSNINMSTFLSNLISTNITNDTESYCQGVGTVDQSQVLTFTNTTIDCTSNPNAGIDLSQNAQLQVTADCMTSALSSLINNVATYQASSQTGAAAASGTAKGASDVIGSIGTALSSIIGAVGNLIASPEIIVIVVLVVIVGVLYFVLKSSASALGGAGHAMIGAPPQYQPQGVPQTPATPYQPPGPSQYQQPQMNAAGAAQNFISNINPAQLQQAYRTYAPLLQKLSGPAIQAAGAVA